MMLAAVLHLSGALDTIRSGGLYVEKAWLPPTLAAALRADALALEAAGKFAPSGVSGWETAAPFGTSDRVVFTLGAGVGGDAVARAELERMLDEVRRALSSGLGRKLTLAEQYYSVHGPGARLSRHMDERHEACKSDGFAETSRRSVSWLVYLNEKPCGGALQTWCRRSRGDCGVDDGNVQVGWLDDVPVFLDAYVRLDGDEAAYGLYVRGDVVEGAGPNKRFVSAPFSADSERWRAATDGRAELPADEFHTALAKMVDDPRAYESVEAVCPDDARQRVVEVAPGFGTLVLFDSASGPHEVLPTEAGSRVAAAGWFHEPTREPPDWYGEDS